MSSLKKESLFEKIKRKTGKKEVECKCNACKQQCKTPCLGTPEDIRKLLLHGYGDRLAVSEWCVGMIIGIEDSPITMLQAKYDENGCTFFKDGLCELHDKGLKPTEGKLSHHTTETITVDKSVNVAVARTWKDKKLVDKFFYGIDIKTEK